MPRYRFTGLFETVLTGLSHGVNAVLHRDDDHGQPDGSTVVAQPGDEIETTEPYLHALMVNVDTGSPDLEVAAPAAPASKPAKKRAPRKAAQKPATAPATPTTPEGQE
jgi:hypothetical protein